MTQIFFETRQKIFYAALPVVGAVDHYWRFTWPHVQTLLGCDGVAPEDIRQLAGGESTTGGGAAAFPVAPDRGQYQDRL